jgi:hypothetical protein
VDGIVRDWVPVLAEVPEGTVLKSPVLGFVVAIPMKWKIVAVVIELVSIVVWLTLNESVPTTDPARADVALMATTAPATSKGNAFFSLIECMENS